MKMEEKEKSDSSTESTDVFSSNFDSLKALYSEKTVLPDPDAPIYDNVNKFELVVLKGHVSKSQGKGVTKKKENVRNFLPHQLPIKVDRSERDSRFAEKNVINKMQTNTGPLGILYQYMENRTRVKIYTRNEIGIRGHVEAFIAAFDKHWNLALEDCLETWSRKVKRKAPATAGNVKIQAIPSEDIYPKVIIKQKTKKIEVLERHVHQLLLRGEQVAMVVKMD